MNVTIKRSTARGQITAPPSKSMAHRDLICGALSSGSRINNLAWSEDIKATVHCLKMLGAQVEEQGDAVLIGGLHPASIKPTTPLYCQESGSTLRFMIPLCLLSHNPVTLTGTARLMERPLGVYADICRKAGLRFTQNGTALTVCGPLRSGHYTLPGDVSSQFISGLLFALPLIDGDSVIEITGKAESFSYIELTIKALSDFGVTVHRTADNQLHIPGGQVYQRRQLTVEGDYSNAAFLEAFNLFGGDVTVNGLDEHSLQGDRVYRALFKRISAGDPTPIDLTDCPDLAPILFAAAAAKNGGTFIGTERLKHKECDRAAAMQAELKKCGIALDIEEHSVTVHAAPLSEPKAIISGHNDHRIVMAMSVLCTLIGGTIADAQAVAKSYPNFFSDIRALGIEVQET